MSVLIAGLIGAGIGATVGTGSYFWGNYNKNKELEKAKDRYKEARDRNVRKMQQEFDIQQKNAFKSADEADVGSTLQEALLGSSINNTLASLSAQQGSQAFGYNTATINAGQSEGASLSQIASGGTRGSSAVQGTAMASALNARALDVQQENDRLANDITLASVMSSAAENAYTLQTRRTEAHDTRVSYSEGGDAYNLFQTTKNNYIADVNAQIDALSDQQTYWSLDQLTSAEGWRKIGSNYLDLTFAQLQGAVTGFNVGATVGGYMQAAKVPALDATASTTSAASSADSLASLPSVQAASPSLSFSPSLTPDAASFKNISANPYSNLFSIKLK